MLHPNGWFATSDFNLAFVFKGESMLAGHPQIFLAQGAPA